MATAQKTLSFFLLPHEFTQKEMKECFCQGLLPILRSDLFNIFKTLL
jgi:hypothetical protein